MEETDRKAAEEALTAIPKGREVWRTHGDALTSVARDHPDSFPNAIREVATAAGMDGDAVVLAATRIAGRLNGRDIVAQLPTDERYHWQRTPNHPDRSRAFWGCTTASIVTYAYPPAPTMPSSSMTPSLSRWKPSCFLGTSGTDWEKADGAGFSIETDHQLALFDGACNECSNCEVYCPEVGAPFKEKERVFSTEALFQASSADGFFRKDTQLMARLGGRSHLLEVRVSDNRARWFMGEVTVELQWDPLKVLDSGPPPGAESQAESRRESKGISFDTATVWRMKTAWESIYHSERPNPVNPGGR